MQDHILFIDTEASGWPKNWNAPYSAKNSWPYCLQASWVLYTKDGIEIKAENYYINEDIKIEPSAFKIHNIDKDTLIKTGKPRKDVMKILAADFEKYQPLLVGHFIELDKHIIDAEFYRADMPDTTTLLPDFCTMQASASYADLTGKKYLRLNELYGVLFNKIQPGQHNAQYDARALAECFFELVKRGGITYDQIDALQQEETKEQNNWKYIATIASLTLIVVLLIIYSLWHHQQ